MDKRTYDSNTSDKRTTILPQEAESAIVWEQLLALAESGDIRAIKLYYEMLEKKRIIGAGRDASGDREMEQLAAIRRAVFGDAAVDAAREAALARAPGGVGLGGVRGMAAEEDPDDL